MKESRASFTSVAVALPMLLVGIGLLAAGLRTDHHALTEDGYPLRGFLLIVGAIMLATGLGFGVFSFLLSVGGQVESAHYRQLEATGWEGAARIERLKPGSTLGNDDNVPVVLTLKVFVPGKTSYQATWNGEVSRVFSGQLRPNEWLRVLVPPGSPQDIHIKWGEMARVPKETTR